MAGLGASLHAHLLEGARELELARGELPARLGANGGHEPGELQAAISEIVDGRWMLAADRPNRVKINEELAPFALALALADQLRDVEEIPLEDNPLSGLDIPAGRSALDLGCGTGQVGAMLKAKGIGFLHGVDLSPEMIEICRTKGIYDRLSIATVEAVADMTELADAFDIVIAMGVAPHLVPEQMLGMIRIGLWAANSSGLLIFNAPNDANGFPLNRLAGSQNHAHAGIVACLEAAGATLGWRDAGEGGDLRRIYWAGKP